MNDAIGDRMKDYENRFRYKLPKRQYIILRLDGKAFHSYTKKLKRPFDELFVQAMNGTAKHLCENIMGAKFAYVQSDEINILMTDFDNVGTEAWFDGNIQKIVSVSASMATAQFLQLRKILSDDDRLAMFDARVFSLADSWEVFNVFVWRQQDAVRNSIQLVAQSMYSHKELMNKNTSELQEMIFQKGINWNDYPNGQKRGRFIKKATYTSQRTQWVIMTPPTFTKDRAFLQEQIPLISNWDTES